MSKPSMKGLAVAPPRPPVPPAPPFPIIIPTAPPKPNYRASGYEGIFGQDLGPLINLVQSRVLNGDSLTLALKLIGGTSLGKLNRLECAQLDALAPVALNMLQARPVPPKAPPRRKKRPVLIDFDGKGLRDIRKSGTETPEHISFANAYGQKNDT